MIYFTSDTHFGHKAVIKYSKRPFSSADDMDEQMIKRWNSRVSPQDHVYHLGDFSFRHIGMTRTILSRLNGHIHLVRGNHDNRKDINRLAEEGLFVWVKDYHELKWEGNLIVMTHYPFEVWNKAHYGSWHVHGHSHGSLRQKREIRRLDVGVDTNDYYPYTINEIQKLVESRKYTAVDHHKG